jgi:hypothetical protein
VDLKEKLDQRAKRFNTENLGTEVRPKTNIRDIERLPLSLMLQTTSKSFRHYPVLITKDDLRGGVGSEKHVTNFSVFIWWKAAFKCSFSIYVNLNGLRVKRYE